MRLTISEARAKASGWLRGRNLPPAVFLQQCGYREELSARAHRVMLRVEELDKTFCCMEFLVHDDGHRSMVRDETDQVLDELRRLGIDMHKRPGPMNHAEALDFFVDSIKYCKDRPRWFIKLDLLTPPKQRERQDALIDVENPGAEGILTIPVKILPSRAMKKAHMRRIDSRNASRMIAMVVNRHLEEAQVAQELFTRLGHIRQSFVKRVA